jgi:hypothetical protein
VTSFAGEGEGRFNSLPINRAASFDHLVGRPAGLRPNAMEKANCLRMSCRNSSTAGRFERFERAVAFAMISQSHIPGF